LQKEQENSKAPVTTKKTGAVADTEASFPKSSINNFTFQQKKQELGGIMSFAPSAQISARESKQEEP
jgi:hypothetical protein